MCGAAGERGSDAAAYRRGRVGAERPASESVAMAHKRGDGAEDLGQRISFRHVLGDPGFLGRRAWPDGNHPSLLGVFVQRNRISSSLRRKVSKLFPTRAPAFVPGRRFLTSFIRDGNGLLDDAKPLAARGGLLLLRISPRPGDKNSDLRLCVCNLFTGRRDFLTPLNAAFLYGKGVQGYALLTAADHGAGPHRAADGYSTFFQVLLLGVSREERQLHLIRFSSSVAGGRKWYSQNCSRKIGFHPGWPCGCCVAAVARGTAHWFFRRNGPDVPSMYTLDVCIITGRISATMLPFDVLPNEMRVDLWNACLGTSTEERLLLFYVKDNHLMIWKHGDGDQVGTSAWRFTSNAQVGVELGLLGIESLSSVCVGEKSGTALALYHSEPECAYMLDLQSGSATKMEGWTRAFNYMTAVPNEINWPLFFMLRHGLRP
nr:unnamed protein product [Digitaria exilis]